MCKFISSDSIIGNFVIESVEKDDFQIELEKLYIFDKELSKRLKKHNYFTNFNVKEISSFKDNYPFIIKSYNNESFSIIQRIESKDEFHSMLIRYFRLGMPKVVINEMKQVLKTILE